MPQNGWKRWNKIGTVYRQSRLTILTTLCQFMSDNKQTADKINKWVEGETREKIKDLIYPDMLNSDTMMVLINAIYFKANWASKFEERFTKSKDFFLLT